MVRGITSTGFNFEINPKITHDMRFIELFAEATNEGTKTPQLVTMILGKEQKEALYKHVEDKDGYVLIEDVDREVGEMLEALKGEQDTKNS